MNKFGVLGWPLTNTFSPQIHELLFVHTGIKGSYSSIREENINQETILKINQGFHGYNITIPHKEKILNLDDSAILSKSVLEIGACNTVLIKNSRMHLFNTDFSGFMDFLDLIDHNFNNKEVLILSNNQDSINKGDYKDFMSKEINEQNITAKTCIKEYVDQLRKDINLYNFPIDPKEIKK